MAKKRGWRSRRARKQENARNLLVDAVVVFGILVSLGLVAVSVALNFRMGYRSADSELDGKLYGAGAALGDCLKAIAPFMMSWGMRNGDLLAAASAVVLFAICTGYSFVSSLGFAAEQRASKAGIVQGRMEGYGDLRGEKERLEARLAFLGPQRSPGEVENAIAAKLKERVWAGGQTVGALSKGCSVDRKSTRAACEGVAKLTVELSAAEEAARLNSELRKVTEKLAAQRSRGAPVSTDAQVDAIGKAVNLVTGTIGKDHIGLGLSILLACFIEVGSGVGLFMVTTPWRGQRRGQDTDGGDKSAERKRALGHVDAYMLARIEPGEGILAVKSLHVDYLRWCLSTKCVGYNEAEFSRRLTSLAEEAGIEVTTRGQRDYCRQVRLRDGAQGGEWRSVA